MQQLCVQTSFLGDVVLTTPLLRALAARGPVDVITTPASAALLEGHPAVRRVIAWDKRGAERGVGGFLALAARLRRAGYQTAYCAQGSLRSAALVTAAAIPERIGFSTSAGRWLYSRRIPYVRSQHHAARLLGLAQLGEVITEDALRPSLAPSAHDRALADTVLAERGGAAPLVALAPGSVWATKRWPHFPALARALAPCRFLVLGGASDAPLAAAITEAVGAASVIDATGRLPLLASAAALARCDVLVTNDSLPQHLASAMGTPTVTLFGPTDRTFGFGPLAPRSTIAQVDDLACRPCHPHGPAVCPLGHHHCMSTLDALRVAALVRPLLPAR
ncbi:MAG: glycosyltransferase family 9 protein [Gemmatimonadaceae bacterium]|nr:glycosyltransferase family 9 protein [Gemmatimonadaceae bacterium]